MNRFATVMITLFAATLLVAAYPSNSQAGSRNRASTGAKVVDAVVVRPVMMVLSLASSSVYLATSPLTMATGVAEETADVLHRRPWKYTNGRPLGKF